MHIRPATRSDLPTLVPLAESAFLNDELDAYRWPHRLTHPTHYHRSILHINRTAFVSPGTHAIACIADPHDTFASPGQILGFAYWWRQPNGKKSAGAPLSATADDATAKRDAERDMRHNTGIEYVIERALLAAEAAYRKLVYPDLSACTREADEALARDFRGLDPHARLPSHWHLNFIAVDPAMSRRGVASALVRWGTDKARAQGVPCSLSSSGAGLRLYEKIGFRCVDWPKFCVDDGWAGGAVFVRDPWDLWVRDQMGSAWGRETTAVWIEHGKEREQNAETGATEEGSKRASTIVEKVDSRGETDTIVNDSGQHIL